MKKILGLIIVGFILSSCMIDYNAESEISKSTGDDALAKINSSRLILLEPGMSKSQVLEKMGTNNAYFTNNPYLISSFSIQEDNITVIYYFTRNPNDDYDAIVTFKSLTPLVLLNGKLIGWGEESLRRAQDKYDFTIKKDFDIKVE